MGVLPKQFLWSFFLERFKNIKIFNRSKKKLILKVKINSYTKNYSLINGFLFNADLIINTTPTNPLNKKQIKI